MSEFQPLDLSYGPAAIRLRVRWILLPGGGAVRAADGEVWEGARPCPRCGTLGYDHGSIDAVLEARRLGIEHAPDAGGCCA